MLEDTNCSEEFSAAHDSGPRTADQIIWIVVHDTEGLTARSAAEWFANAIAQPPPGSAQLVVDDTTCYRTLDDLVIPWAARGANRKGVHIEQAGFADWSMDEWLLRDLTIERCAFHVARWCHLYGIPSILLAADDMANGKAGIATHATVTAAFRQDDHYDPGPNYPLDELIRRVKTYLAPSITGISPQSGIQGIEVLIQGRNFLEATDVGFGDLNAASIAVDSDSQIRAVSPQGQGTIHITVIGPNGMSAISAADQFTYL